MHARSLRGLGIVDPAREAGKLIQRITKGTLRATEAWTDGRHAEDDKHVELDCELAVALASVTEGAARATVLRITQTEPSYGEMMADDGPVPMVLGNVGTHDTKMTRNDSDTSNDMSYEDVRAIAWKGYKVGKGAGKKGLNGSGTWHRGKGADQWPSGKRDDGGKKGGKKGSKGSKPDGTVTRTRQGQGKRQGQGQRQE